MLNSIKELLNSNLLQSGANINASDVSKRDSTPNYHAGADILAHYQDIWEELHKLSETNATKAEQLAQIISKVQSRQKSDNAALVAITQALETPVNVNQKVQADDVDIQQGDAVVDSKDDKVTLKSTSLICGLQLAIVTFKKLQLDAEKVEEGLVQLENVIEEIELEKKKKEHLNQFRLYEERKMEELQEYRNYLANKHAKSMLDQDLKEKLKLQERQEVFQDAFKSDLETYKTLGTIPKIQTSTSNKSSAMLDEIQLDADTEDLEEFLKDNEPPKGS